MYEYDDFFGTVLLRILWVCSMSCIVQILWLLPPTPPNHTDKSDDDDGNDTAAFTITRYYLTLNFFLVII